jgi:hypothetical protein
LICGSLDFCGDEEADCDSRCSPCSYTFSCNLSTCSSHCHCNFGSCPP